MDPDKEVKNLIWVKIVTPQKVSPRIEKWIAQIKWVHYKGVRGC
jgi:hypothetical protein